MRLSSIITKGSSRARTAFVLGTAIAVTAAMSPSGAAESERRAEPKKPPPSASAEVSPHYDARSGGTTTSVTTRAARVAASPTEGVRDLREELGVQGIVDVDPLTRTPRVVHKVDGFLTQPSSKAPAEIARAYIRDHQDVFRLSPEEVQSLTLRKDYRDVAGTHHLSFVQTVDGLTVFGNGLRAHVAQNGRLVQVDGSPLAQTQESLARPTLSAAQARSAAVRDVQGRSKATIESQAGGSGQETTFGNGDQAELVAFQTSGGLRTAWQTITLEEGYLHVIDAESGRTLFRQSLVHSDSGRVWGNYPGADRGGKAQEVNFTAPGWLPNNSPSLRGNVAHVWKDVNDDDVAQASEEVTPSGGKNFNYPLTPFTPAACVPGFVCSWDPETEGSWKTNANQTAVQLFSFLGRFHDHLAAKPIGFTPAAGNFEAVDGDAVQGQAIDGATTDDGMPDGNHVDNANMLTPPDGTAPIMQMYLFHQPGTAFPTEDPFIAANSGDEADVVYHEYTHGLSNRLVVDANGNSTLGEIQAGAMGEAWGDWYAMDYLVKQGFFRDTPADGDLRIGEYVGWGNDLIRYQPIDCPVGVDVPRTVRARPVRDRAASPTATRARVPRPGGALGRRDLGRHALGSPEGDRLPTRGVARDPRHGAVAAEPVVPGHAQRDPARRRDRRQGEEAEEDLAGLRQARHGLLRRRHRRGRRRAGRGLLDAAAGQHPQGIADGDRDRRRDGRHGRGRNRRLWWTLSTGSSGTTPPRAMRKASTPSKASCPAATRRCGPVATRGTTGRCGRSPSPRGRTLPTGRCDATGRHRLAVQKWSPSPHRTTRRSAVARAR